MSELIDKTEIVAVLEEELQTVKWLADKAPTAQRKAAAALRVLQLEKEIEVAKTAA